MDDRTQTNNKERRLGEFNSDKTWHGVIWFTSERKWMKKNKKNSGDKGAGVLQGNKRYKNIYKIGIKVNI